MNIEYIDKHEAYLLLKQKAETYMLPTTKEAYERAARLIDSIKTCEVQSVNDWISVKDRLPEYDKTVLVVNEDGYMHTAVRIKGSIARVDEWQIKFGVCFTDNDVWEENEQGKITHWQYLPEPPKGSEINGT